MRTHFALALGLTLLAAPTWAQTTLSVRTAPIADEKAVFATVESPNVVPARARNGGTVARLSIREGDTVRRGQAIATIADDKLLLQINALDAQIAGLQSQLAQAQTDLTRTETLFRQNVGPRTAMDNARTALDVASATLRARIADRAVAQQQLAEGEVLAPADGRVLRVPVTNGTVILPGDALASIAEAGFVLRLRVPEHHAQFLKKGDRIRLDGTELGAGGQARFGAITLVYPQIEEGRVLADADVEGLGDFYVGQRIRVWISAGTRPAIVIPSTFVRTSAGLDYVRLGETKTAIDIPVQRGADRPTPAMPDGLEILSGLRDGDTLIRP